MLSLSLFFQSGPLAPGGAAFFLYIVGLLWTIAVSIMLLTTRGGQLTDSRVLPQRATAEARGSR